jgi:hydrogenase maturation protein HypF
MPRDPREHTVELVLGRSYARMPADLIESVRRDPAAVARWLLKRGAIIGVKGLGGFHVAASAEIDATVRALRQKKNRPAKPFALMCRSTDVAREIAEIDPAEARALESPWSPIVLLRKRPTPGLEISPSIAPRNRYLGIMLPYAPLHHLLFDDDLTVLIMTSANPSGEPIAASLAEAERGLRGVTRTFLDHNRGVVNRNDDSIVFVEGGVLGMSRRSRGYAPYPIDLSVETGEVLACGTELKNTFTLLRDGWAFTSQHIGDMENQATLEFFEEMVGKFMRWFRVEPSVVAHDLHPDYLATRYAKEYARAHPGVALEGVQHHHAHIAAVAIENGVTDPVIGLSLDGTGYGTDGKIWGCEFLIADLAGFERAGHLGYVPLPGGDAAIRHPYRVALSHLHAAGEKDLAARGRKLFPEIPEDELALVVQQIEKGVNSIDTSSAGRLFDAVSAILGVCHEISYEAQAAIELESVADEGESRTYPATVSERDGRMIVDPGPIVLAVLDDFEGGTAREAVAGAFHNTVVGFCQEVAVRLRDARGIGTVALSGGVFQNRLLFRKLVAALSDDGFRVLFHREVPTNDGGVSLGQAVVANERALARRAASP